MDGGTPARQDAKLSTRRHIRSITLPQRPEKDAMTSSPAIRALACILPLFIASTLGAQQTVPAGLGARIDQIFARFTRTTPGCAVGLAKDGRTLYVHGYGSANLEYGVPQHRQHGVRERVRREAVHRERDLLLVAGRQAVARRRHPKVSAGGAVVRRTEDHDSQSADAHERSARPVGTAGHRGPRAGHAGPLAADDARSGRPSENAELPAGERISLQQLRLCARRR